MDSPNTSRDAAVSFAETETRSDDMHRTVAEWIEDLVALVDAARASQEFQRWLDVQSRFHDYSHRNTLLIKQQYTEATKVAGYRTWQTEFNRHVVEGATAIWIWAPITARRCPDCGNSPSYRDHTRCNADASNADEWSRGVVGFKPVSVFDISQTTGEPLPELDTEATGDASGLVDRLPAVAGQLRVNLRIVDESSWSHEGINGVCYQPSTGSEPVVKIRQTENAADVVATTIHECAHSLLHVGIDDETERAKRELEAEAVAYVVGRYLGLDVDGSAFYLAAWHDDESATILERLDRISKTAETVIDAFDCVPTTTNDETRVNL